jgi:hypothetical protein
MVTRVGAHPLVMGLRRSGFGWWLMAVLAFSCCLSWPATAQAKSRCQQINGQTVCLQSIKRSAKYHWEYRVVVSIDGKVRATKRYDCHQPPAKIKPSLPPEIQREKAIQQFVCGLVP